MIDKYSAEELGLLKIDALGLRTLTILEQILEQIGKDYEYLYKLPLNDQLNIPISRTMRMTCS